MTVRIEKAEPVTTIIIDRPQRRNAVDRDTAEALADAFAAFDEDEQAQVAVLCGAGETFCAGADLKAIAEGKPNRLDASGHGPMGPTRMRLTKPVIAAISGHAVAGGLELAVWCDLRVMEEDAVMGVFCRRFGVPLIDGGTIRLPRLIGHSRAMDLILTGRPVDSKEALAIGLANRVVPSGQAREAAQQLARTKAAFPTAAMRGDMLSACQQWDMPLSDALENEFRHGLQALTSGSLAGVGRFAKGEGRHGKIA